MFTGKLADPLAQAEGGGAVVGLDFDAWVSEHSTTEQYHFIGKDITYFHTLFWPGMLKTAGYSLPKKVHIHGFLTVDGEMLGRPAGRMIQDRSPATAMPADFMASILSSAPPLPPETMAPAWPMRLPGGAVTPAM